MDKEKAIVHLHRQLLARLTAQRLLSPVVLGCLLAAIISLGSGILVYRMTFERAVEDLRGSAAHRLDLYASSLEREIDKYAKFPYVVGFDSSLNELLEYPDNAVFKQRSNLYLERLNERVGTLAMFMLDATGTVVASSNWNRSDSFVGRDLSYRPYYRNAGVDKIERFYGIGTTNNEPGYFLATELHRAGHPRGVGVVKVSLEQLERSWSSAESPAILSDDHGVVVLSSVAAWKYSTLQPLDQEARRLILNAQQYNGRQLNPIGMKIRRILDSSSSIVLLPALGQANSGAFTTAGLFLAQTRMMSGTPWRLTVFVELKEADDLAKMRAALAALGAAFVLGAAFLFAMRQKHTRELLSARAALQRAHDELECKVVERTADLYATIQQLHAETEERERAERTLHEAQRELVQAGKLAELGQLFTGIAHELNQPLAALATLCANAVKLLKRGDVETTSSNLERITPLIERMGRLTGQLKSYARKSSGEPRAVLLQKCIDNVLYLLHYRLMKGQVELSMGTELGDVYVWCDANRLEQVLVNLISNALDAMEEVTPRRIALRISALNGSVQLEIRDSGPGLSEETLKHIFEPFYTTKAAGVGLGLGLPISAGIIRDFGGELKAGNAPEGGAVFTLIIPASKENSQ